MEDDAILIMGVTKKPGLAKLL